jgi:hypothetical protein
VKVIVFVERDFLVDWSEMWWWCDEILVSYGWELLRGRREDSEESWKKLGKFRISWESLEEAWEVLMILEHVEEAWVLVEVGKTSKVQTLKF